MATNVNLLIDQGSTFTISVLIVDDNDNPIDFTGYSAQSEMRKSYMSANAYSFNVSLNSNGFISLGMSANTTNSIPAGRYVYDIELTDPNSNIIRIAQGIATVTPGVTH